MTRIEFKTVDLDELPAEMVNEAEKLGEGGIFAYRDGNCIRMETDTGESPYVWRSGKWVPMTL